MKISAQKSLVILGFSLLCLCSCKALFDNKIDNGGDLVQPVGQKDAITNYVKAVELSLDTQNLLPSRNKIASTGALEAVDAIWVEGATLESLIPVAAGGAVASVGKMEGLDDDGRETYVKAITAAYVCGLQGQFEATSLSRTVLGTPATQSNEMIQELLARVSAAAISNLAKTGITAERRSEAAGAVVNTMIASLNGGGVNKMLVSDSLSRITQAAIQSLKDGGFTEEEAIGAAVQAIAKGAISAIPSITVPGIDNADFATLTESISSGAANGFGAISVGLDKNKLAGALASGSAQGIIAAVQKDSTIPKDTIRGMISSSTAGITKSILSADSPTNELELIGVVTSALSGVLTANTQEGMPTDEEMLGEITTGAAKAAILSGVDSSALANAITLMIDSGTTYNTEAAIASGVLLAANNPPVANAGPDLTILAGTKATLISDCTDPDTGTTLTYTWTLVSKPSASSDFSLGTMATAEFTPTITGSYIVSLKVSDGKAMSEAFCLVSVQVAGQDAVYQGKTFNERFVGAQTLYSDHDFYTARDELLILVSRYPESAGFPEALFLLAETYEKLDQLGLAELRYSESLKRFPTSDSAPKTKIALAFILLQHNNVAEAKTLFTELATFTGSQAIRLDAQIGLGAVDIFEGKFTEGRIKLSDVLSATGVELEQRYKAQWSTALSYTFQQNWEMAEQEILNLIEGKKFTHVNPDDPATFEADRLCNIYVGFCNRFSHFRKTEKKIEFLENGLTDTRFNAGQLIQLRYTLGELYRCETEYNVENTQKGIDNFIAGMKLTDTGIEAKKALASMGMALGESYLRMMDFSKTETERNTNRELAETTLLKVVSDYSSTPYGVDPVGCARWCLGNLYRGKDNNKAIGFFKTVAENYPLDEPSQWPRAESTYSLGQVYMDLGYDYSNQYGKDPIAMFQKAAYWFKKAKIENFAGKTDIREWSFLPVEFDLGQAYVQLGQFEDAKTQFNLVLATNDLWGNTWVKSGAQRGFANIEYKAVENQVQEGRFTEALTTMVDAEVFVNAIGTTSEFDAYCFSDALLDCGQKYFWIAERMRDSGKETADYYPVFVKAEEFFARNTTDKFPTIEPLRWTFFYSEKRTAESRIYRGLYEEGQELLLALQTKYKDCESGWIFDLKNSYAQSWKRHANEIQWKDSLSDTEIADVKTWLHTALTSFQALIDEYKDDSEREENSGWIQTDIGWTLNDLWSIETKKDRKLASTAVIDDLLAKQIANVASAAKYKTLYNGEIWIRVNRALGDAYKNKAWDVATKSTNDRKDPDFKANMEKAVTVLLESAACTNADGWEIMWTQDNLVDAYVNLAQIPDATDWKTHWEKAITLADSTLADTEGHFEATGSVAKAIAWGYINLGNVMAKENYLTEAKSRTAASFYAKLVTDNSNYNGMWQQNECKRALQWLNENPPAGFGGISVGIE